eukprot:2820245-Alexandrium_andersonii.AAC.1
MPMCTRGWHPTPPARQPERSPTNASMSGALKVQLLKRKLTGENSIWTWATGSGFESAHTNYSKATHRQST